MCLHRELGRPFSRDEALFVKRIAGHLAEGIRAGLAVGGLDFSDPADAPGVVLLREDAVPVAMTPAAEAWLEELGHPPSAELPLPTEILALAANVRALRTAEDSVPRLRMRTRAGRWAALYASRMPSAGAGAIAVVIEQASAAEVAPVIMLAYGLTQQERKLTGLVCQGLSTAEVAAQLHISLHTVQDHLKSVFEKVGVRSRRELVATILRDHYLPGAKAGRQVAPTGFFA